MSSPHNGYSRGTPPRPPSSRRRGNRNPASASPPAAPASDSSSEGSRAEEVSNLTGLTNLTGHTGTTDDDTAASSAFTFGLLPKCCASRGDVDEDEYEEEPIMVHGGGSDRPRGRRHQQQQQWPMDEEGARLTARPDSPFDEDRADGLNGVTAHRAAAAADEGDGTSSESSEDTLDYSLEFREEVNGESGRSELQVEKKKKCKSKRNPSRYQKITADEGDADAEQGAAFAAAGGGGGKIASRYASPSRLLVPPGKRVPFSRFDSSADDEQVEDDEVEYVKDSSAPDGRPAEVRVVSSFKERAGDRVGLVFTRATKKKKGPATTTETMIARVMPGGVFEPRRSELEGSVVRAVNSVAVSDPRHAAVLVSRAVGAVSLSVAAAGGGGAAAAASGDDDGEAKREIELQLLNHERQLLEAKLERRQKEKRNSDDRTDKVVDALLREGASEAGNDPGIQEYDSDDEEGVEEDRPPCCGNIGGPEKKKAAASDAPSIAEWSEANVVESAFPRAAPVSAAADEKEKSTPKAKDGSAAARKEERAKTSKDAAGVIESGVVAASFSPPVADDCAPPGEVGAKSSEEVADSVLEPKPFSNSEREEEQEQEEAGAAGAVKSATPTTPSNNVVAPENEVNEEDAMQGPQDDRALLLGSPSEKNKKNKPSKLGFIRAPFRKGKDKCVGDRDAVAVVAEHEVATIKSAAQEEGGKVEQGAVADGAGGAAQQGSAAVSAKDIMDDLESLNPESPSRRNNGPAEEEVAASAANSDSEDAAQPVGEGEPNPATAARAAMGAAASLFDVDDEECDGENISIVFTDADRAPLCYASQRRYMADNLSYNCEEDEEEGPLADAVEYQLDQFEARENVSDDEDEEEADVKAASKEEEKEDADEEEKENDEPESTTRDEDLHMSKHEAADSADDCEATQIKKTKKVNFIKRAFQKKPKEQQQPLDAKDRQQDPELAEIQSKDVQACTKDDEAAEDTSASKNAVDLSYDSVARSMEDAVYSSQTEEEDAAHSAPQMNEDEEEPVVAVNKAVNKTAKADAQEGAVKDDSTEDEAADRSATLEGPSAKPQPVKKKGFLKRAFSKSKRSSVRKGHGASGEDDAAPPITEAAVDNDDATYVVDIDFDVRSTAVSVRAPSSKKEQYLFDCALSPIRPAPTAATGTPPLGKKVDRTRSGGSNNDATASCSLTDESHDMMETPQFDRSVQPKTPPTPTKIGESWNVGSLLFGDSPPSPAASILGSTPFVEEHRSSTFSAIALQRSDGSSVVERVVFECRLGDIDSTGKECVDISMERVEQKIKDRQALQAPPPVNRRLDFDNALNDSSTPVHQEHHCCGSSEVKRGLDAEVELAMAKQQAFDIVRSESKLQQKIRRSNSRQSFMRGISTKNALDTTAATADLTNVSGLQ